MSRIDKLIMQADVYASFLNQHDIVTRTECFSNHNCSLGFYV